MYKKILVSLSLFSAVATYGEEILQKLKSPCKEMVNEAITPSSRIGTISDFKPGKGLGDLNYFFKDRDEEFIYEDENLRKEEEPQKFENPCKDMMKEGVLPSARKCIGKICESRKAGVIGNLEFLYFQTKEDGFEYVAENNTVSADSSNINLNAKTVNFDFSYKPGFKLGLGFYIPRISWDFSFNWMDLNTKCSQTNRLAQTDEGIGLIPLFWSSAAFNNNKSYIRFSESRAKLKLSINSLDAEVGDSFFTSPHISLRLHGGLKGAIIHQKFYVSYNDGNTILDSDDNAIGLLTGLTKIRSDYKGLGPRIGLDSSWNIYCSDFNIIASGSIAFLLSRFDVRHHEHDTAYNYTSDAYLSHEFKIHDYVWLVRPAAQMKLGIDWGRCFGSCTQYYFAMNAAYEMEYFWEQNLSRRLIDEQVYGISYPNKGDLFLHGLVISAHLEF